MKLAARAQARSSVWGTTRKPCDPFTESHAGGTPPANYAAETIRTYIGAVERFARYFGKPPDQLGPEHIRQYQAYLLHERKLAVGTVVTQVAGLRFFFVRTLKRRYPPDTIPYPRHTKRRMPTFFPTSARRRQRAYAKCCSQPIPITGPVCSLLSLPGFERESNLV
jgi:hypothetical protein